MSLLKKASGVMKKAHAPYSKFRVGSAVVGGSGKIYLGCNVENASYGATICAERTAITQAIACGEKKITEIAIINSSKKPVTPCGLCLQVMVEFCAPDVQILSADVAQKKTLKFTLQELIPHAFSRRFLK